jgi:hypothetical protein
MRKQVLAVLLAMTLALPTAFISHAADPVYPEGVPAPNRDCGTATGATLVDSITQKQMTCTAVNGKNLWQNSDGSTPAPVVDQGQEKAPVGTTDEQWIAPDPTTPNTIGYVANENLFYKHVQSSFASFTMSGTTFTAVSLCKSNSACTYESLQRFDAVLPQCGTDAVNCIQSVFAKDESGKSVPVTIIGKFPEGTPDEFAGDPSVNLPTGTVPLLVDIPSKPHAGGSQYMVRAIISGYRDKSQNQTKFVIENFDTQIYAIKIVDGKYGTTSISNDITKYNKGDRPYSNTGSRAQEICAAASATKCALGYPLPENLSLGVEIKFSAGVSGWLRGRVKSPQVSITGSATSGQTLRMEGFPIHVPSIYTWIPKSPLPATLQAFYSNGLPEAATKFVLTGTDGSKPENMIYQYGGGFFDEHQWNQFLAWLPVVGDKATVNPSYWHMGTMSNWNDNTAKNNPCFNSKTNLVGIVTTNATQFLEGPPSFNKESGSLDYQVAAPHFTPTGEVFSGTYDLVMSSEVARCLYKFSSAPVKATISIAGDSGSQVATTLLTEKDGWLRLGAYGFTFSNPTIRVKLNQTVAKTTVTKKITITCVKGKTSKKVTAVKPVCPKGYVKK